MRVSGDLGQECTCSYGVSPACSVNCLGTVTPPRVLQALGPGWGAACQAAAGSITMTVQGHIFLSQAGWAGGMGSSCLGCHNL